MISARACHPAVVFQVRFRGDLIDVDEEVAVIKAQGFEIRLIPLPTVNQHVVSGVGLPGSAERVGSG